MQAALHEEKATEMANSGNSCSFEMLYEAASYLKKAGNIVGHTAIMTIWVKHWDVHTNVILIILYFNRCYLLFDSAVLMYIKISRIRNFAVQSYYSTTIEDKI